MKRAGLYLHIPFCRTKCYYCSFSSFPCRSEPSVHYIEALVRHAEIMASHPWVQDATFTTFFVGGGTPTIYDGLSLRTVIKECLKLFNFADQPEISIEANPNTITVEKLLALQEAGVNRVSIGIQSFSDRLLQIMGRSHTREEAINCLEITRRAGYTNMNIDLIYGLPGQSKEDWAQSLDIACGYMPEHMSLYELTVEEETPFGKLMSEKKLRLPLEETLLAMETAKEASLKKYGYERYEISNYSRPGYRCRHNINYWHNGSYVGLGAGAVSCFSGFRISNIADPDAYCRLTAQKEMPFAEGEFLDRRGRYRETVIMGLRMLEGIAIEQLRHQFGVSPQQFYGELLDRLISEDMLEISEGYMRLTPKGLPVANQILAMLV